MSRTEIYRRIEDWHGAQIPRAAVRRLIFVQSAPERSNRSAMWKVRFHRDATFDSNNAE